MSNTFVLSAVSLLLAGAVSITEGRLHDDHNSHHARQRRLTQRVLEHPKFQRPMNADDAVEGHYMVHIHETGSTDEDARIRHELCHELVNAAHQDAASPPCTTMFEHAANGFALEHVDAPDMEQHADGLLDLLDHPHVANIEQTVKIEMDWADHFSWGQDRLDQFSKLVMCIVFVCPCC